MVRLNDLPKSVQKQVLAKAAEPDMKGPKPRAEKNHGVWRCVGRNGCGEVIDGTSQSMERHLDAHGGGARAEAVFATRGRA